MANLRFLLLILFLDLTIAQTCHYKGMEYLENDTILIDEPCLACTCQKGALVCSLRVCPKLPDPPPRGCIVLHKKDHCCPQLQCEDINQIEKATGEVLLNKLTEYGCLTNGSLYSEGSAMASSSDCEYCYCINGRQTCVRPHCHVPDRGCRPVFNDHTCCPVQYNCTDQDKSDNYVRISKERGGCEVNGTLFKNGDVVPSEGSCEVCYCIRNQITCGPVRCTIQHLEGCFPVYSSGGCCPHAYNCSMSHGMGSRSFRSQKPKERPTIQPVPIEDNSTEDTTTSEQSESTTYFDVTSTEQEKETTDFTTLTNANDFSTTEYTTNVPEFSTISDVSTTETFLNDVIITAPPQMYSLDVKSNLRLDNQIPKMEMALERAQPIPPEEVLLNATSVEPEEDYENLDYTEPKLPPSLPNIVIFPFLAADAVPKGETKVIEAEEKVDHIIVTPTIYPGFSPPLETEGGFVPKEDDEFPTPVTSGSKKDQADISSVENLLPSPSLTTSAKPKSDFCISEDKQYRHGELTSPPGECLSCVCFYGEVICQEANCPTVPTGCARTNEKQENSCCGKIQCPDDVLFTTSIPSNPPFSTTSVILEPLDLPEDPSKEVIKTEEAPDLPSLMDEILPFLKDQQTTKPVSVNYKNTVVNYYPKHQITTTRDSEQKTTMMVEKAPEMISVTTPMGTPFTDLTSMSPVYRPTTETFVEKPQTEPTISSVDTSTFDTSTKYPVENTITTIPSTTASKLLIGSKPKPGRDSVPSKTTTTKTSTTESDSFLDEFLKGFFESNEDTKAPSTTTTSNPLPHKYNHKYSSQIRNPPPILTTTMPSIEIIENREGEEPETTNSFSFDSVLSMLFDAENQETSTVRIATKPKNSTAKFAKKPPRKTKKPSSTTTTMVPTTEKTTTLAPPVVVTEKSTQRLQTTTTMKPTRANVESSFVTDQNTGFPKINILQQGVKKPSINSETFKGVVSKQPESVRKPIKMSNSISGILKLDGCNIYGRMYRVGKIIAELTNPCLECMCTESGVQCSKIVC